MSIPIGANTNLHLNPAANTAGLSHQHTFIDTKLHHLTGTGSIDQQLMKGGLTTVGAGAAYTHIPSGSQLGVAGSHTSRGVGTTISAAGNLNLHQGPNARLDAMGNYSKHFPSGMQTAGAGLNLGTPAGTGVNVGVQHTNRGVGTVKTVGATVNMAPGVDAYAQCSKGRFGKPDCNVGIKVQKHF